MVQAMIESVVKFLNDKVQSGVFFEILTQMYSNNKKA